MHTEGTGKGGRECLTSSSAGRLWAEEGGGRGAGGWDSGGLGAHRWAERCAVQAQSPTQFRTLPHASLSQAQIRLFFFLRVVCLLGHSLAMLIWFSLFPAQRENFPFRLLQISSSANSSCSRTDGLAWLGDVQTHRWSNDSDTISFVKPWSRGKFSHQQWEKLQRVFQVYRTSFTRDIQELVKMVSVIHCKWRDGALNRYPMGETVSQTPTG